MRPYADLSIQYTDKEVSHADEDLWQFSLYRLSLLTRREPEQRDPLQSPVLQLDSAAHRAHPNFAKGVRTMNQIFKQLSKSRMILYLVLTPLSVWTSVASSLVLQPVLDAGLAKDLPAFVRASAWGLILAVLDFVVYYFACTCRQRILAGYIRALRVRYFSFLLRQRPGRFLEQDTAAHLSKLTAEAETVGDKYCGSLLSLYRALWSLALSVAAIVSARWELAIVVVQKGGDTSDL